MSKFDIPKWASETARLLRNTDTREIIRGVNQRIISSGQVTGDIEFEILLDRNETPVDAVPAITIEQGNDVSRALNDEPAPSAGLRTKSGRTKSSSAADQGNETVEIENEWIRLNYGEDGKAALEEEIQNWRAQISKATAAATSEPTHAHTKMPTSTPTPEPTPTTFDIEGEWENIGDSIDDEWENILEDTGFKF